MTATHLARPHAAFAAALALALAASACGREGGGDGAARRAAGEEAKSSGGIVLPPTEPYRVSTLSAVGKLVGSLEIDESAQPVEGGPATGSTPSCDASVEPSRTPDELITVVWADAPRQGKPLPIERRYQLVVAGCELEPRVQGIVAGGAVNVFNDDRALHRLVFIRAGTTDTVQVMPFTNSGQIVASDRVAKTPGIIEVRCTEHSWAHGWLAVFDHPYFAVAEPGATFTIDSLPTGQLRLLSWREGTEKPVLRTAEIRSGEETAVVVK